MNTLFKYKSIICMISLLILTAGCVRDDDADCNNRGEIIIRVLDGQNNDITETDAIKDVILYLFGSKNTFIDSIPIPISIVKSRKPIILEYPRQSHLTAVVWCNTIACESTEVDDLDENKHNIESPLKVWLKPNGGKTKTTNLYNSPEELFHGKGKIGLDSSTGVQSITFPVKRKVSSIIVIAKRLRQWAGGGTDEDFSIQVRGTSDTYSLVDGELEGGDATYAPDISFDENDYLVSPLFNTFPSDRTQRVEVEIYKGENCIYRASLDNEGNPLVAEEGRTLQVVIDFQASISVDVSINPWHVVNQYTDL
ncbi:FimB/Mfa2 family fimbrial subunit [uncultured Dysgonomonas sp.]|uniref:Fimbrillin-A associated anchor proteins Mfa1 and Mfa2 n=1 Tax=uncultured Dysgonomonas sp. TaxID=206096 RepID=A0A212JAT1_9BACT|nr:FimB/Mfa2 family fimbrial subunit [uncultured Dysgonomonas sp.]SBV96521.1 hypothetical protein KL86DYS1_11669 [uncultured Dysgonomonas sp.]